MIYVGSFAFKLVLFTIRNCMSLYQYVNKQANTGSIIH